MGNHGSSRSAAVSQPTVAPDMVRQVQAKLRDGGYYKQGSVDGVWGAGTEASVRSFQRDHNLTANGQLDVPTLQALNLSGPSANTAANNPPPNNNYPANNNATNYPANNNTTNDPSNTNTNYPASSTQPDRDPSAPANNRPR